MTLLAIACVTVGIYTLYRFQAKVAAWIVKCCLFLGALGALTYYGLPVVKEAKASACEKAESLGLQMEVCD